MVRQTKKQVEVKPESKSILDNPAIQKKFLDTVRLGATIADACGVCGFSDDLLRLYLKRNSDFSESYYAARHEAKVSCVASIRKAATGNWQAAAWFLERSDPETWGRTQKIILKCEPDLLKRLQAQADASGVDLASIFEAMINEFATIAPGNSETDA